tara:strand:+ start:3 stop:1871 length:1869 start_codon:yes stop_codon:yes gene_type:complete
MARATLEMFLKLTGADKTSRGLDKVSNATRELDNTVEKADKSNAKFASGMSGASKLAVAGGAIFAAKTLFDFSKSAVQAAVAAEEAGAAFGTTFGTAAERATKFLEGFANKAGLTVGEAQQLQSVLGAVAQGIGFTQEESADLSIELTKIAADVASFSNISAGAEPVLQAFRSALVGEREALKTYGIAITEAEVQTKAFEITTKKSADALTRQDKALATLALIQDKAAVQIGDLDRTAASFANQSRLVSAELRQLKEDIGDELIPVLAELLPKFRDLVNDISPSLISAVSGTANAVINLVLALDRLNDLDEGLLFLIHNFSDLADEQRALNAISDRTADSANLLAIQTAFQRKEAEKARQAALKQQVQYKKVSDTIDKFLNPIFGEQNALLLTNIQLETDRNRLLKLTSSANDNVEKAEKERAKALKNVEELQIAENVADAQAAIRKSELQTQIGLLTSAEESGKDVTNELALARAELAEAEFELLNDSDRLIAARGILEVAENNLSIALDNQKKSIDTRNDALLESIDLTNKAAEANKKLIDQGALLTQFRQLETAPVTTAPATTEVPSLPVTDFSTTFAGGRQQTSTIDVNLNLTDAIGEIIQEQNIKIQERGNTFFLEG